MNMKRIVRAFLICVLLLAFIFIPGAVAATGATDSIHIVKYAIDKTTVIAEKTVTYQWMEENLPVYGDGVTHYYHQGPVFEGDMWDVTETQNLKDKGAVKGTDARDLCDLVGGMVKGDEIKFIAVDGWHTEFAYENIYEPQDRQGPVALCWYSGGDAESGERYGTGYPGVEGYNSAIQMVIMAKTTNTEGKYVFGNDDMCICLPQEKYQHFYEGLPSTNGLSGKWIAEIDIFSQEPVPAVTSGAEIKTTIVTDLTTTTPVTTTSSSNKDGGLKSMLWLIIACGVVGIGLLSFAIIRLRRKAS